MEGRRRTQREPVLMKTKTLLNKKDWKAFYKVRTHPSGAFHIEHDPELKPYEFRVSENGFLMYVGTETGKLLLDYAKEHGNAPRIVSKHGTN